MHSITQCLNYPDGTPIDAVQGLLAKTYPPRTIKGQYGDRTVQNGELTDVGGNKIRLCVWQHPDLKELEGQEFIIHSSKGGKSPGIVVKHGEYAEKKTIELSVNKAGVFQHVEVYKSLNPKENLTPSAGPSVVVAIDVNDVVIRKTPIEGVLAGMAINQACLNLSHRGLELNPREIYRIASDIIRVSQFIQKGNLSEASKEPEPAPTVVDCLVATKPASDDNPY